MKTRAAYAILLLTALSLHAAEPMIPPPFAGRLPIRATARPDSDSDRKLTTPRPSLTKSTFADNAVIRGRVFESDGTTPVNDFRVTVQDTFGFIVFERGFHGTNVFVTRDLRAGSYLVSVRKNGSSQWTCFPDAADIAAAQPIPLAAGQTASIDIRLRAEGTGDTKLVTFTGRCYVGPDTTQPISPGESLRLRVVRADSTYPYWWYAGFDLTESVSCWLEDDGSYSVSASLRPGSYYVLAGFDDRPYVDRWLNGGDITTTTVPLDINGGTRRFDLHFDIGGAIRGHVRDADTSAMRAYVTISAIDEDGLVLARDGGYYWPSSGEFMLEGLPPGRYYVGVTSNLYMGTGYGSRYYPGVDSISQAGLIEVAANDTVSLDTLALRFYRGSSGDTETGVVRGLVTEQVTGHTVEGAYQSLEATDGQHPIGYHGTPGDSSMQYEWEVPAGVPFVISAYHTEDYYLAPTYYGGTIDRTQATVLEAAPAETLRADIAMLPGGSAAGYVSAQGGGPLVQPGTPEARSWNEGGRGVYGFAWSADPAPMTYAYVSELSGLRFVGLPAGSWSLLLVPVTYGGCDLSEWYTSATFGPAQVTAGSTTVVSGMTLATASGRIAGSVSVDPAFPYAFVYVYDSDGRLASIGWASSEPQPSERPAELFYERHPAWETLTKSYCVGYLKSGRYAVSALVYDHAWELRRQWYDGLTWATPGGTDDREYIMPDIPSQATWVTVNDGQTVTDIDFGPLAVSPSISRTPARASLWLTNASNRGALHVGYRLDTAPAERANARLEVYLPDGRRVWTTRLTKREGVVVWDGAHTGGGAGGAGVYLIVLRGESVQKSLRLLRL